MSRESHITGLRALALWLEEHPDVPYPEYSAGISVTSAGRDDVGGEAWVMAAAVAAGHIEPTVTDHHIGISHQAAGIRYEVLHIWQRTMVRYDLIQDLGRRAAEAIEMPA